MRPTLPDSEYAHGRPPLPAADYAFLKDAGAGLAPSLRGARLFIAGGTGVIGSWLVEALVALNDAHALGLHLTLLSRNPAAFAERRPHLARARAIELVKADVRALPDISGAYKYVIHAAVDSVRGDLSRLGMIDTIVGGTRGLLEFAAQARPEGFLFVSSNAVYGRAPIDTDFIDETCTAGPRVTDADIDYDESKRMAEALCVIYARERSVPAKIARCFPVVGPYLPLDAHFAVGNFIRDAMAGGPIVVRGNGLPVRSYIYLADAAIWLLTVLIKGETASPYNVGSEEAVAIRDLAGAVASGFEPAPEVSVQGGPGGESRFVPSTHKARTELGLSLAYDLKRSLRTTIDYHRQIIPQSPEL